MDDMATAPARRAVPAATLPGPSRTITVEPITAPREQPAPAPEPAPPAPREEPEREPEPQPVQR